MNLIIRLWNEMVLWHLSLQKMSWGYWCLMGKCNCFYEKGWKMMKWRWRRTSLAVKKGDNAQLWWRLQGREREREGERELFWIQKALIRFERIWKMWILCKMWKIGDYCSNKRLEIHRNNHYLWDSHSVRIIVKL